MTIRRPPFVFLLALALSVTACERSTEGLAPAPPNTDPVVFMDDFGESVNWSSFNPAEGADVNALDIDYTAANVYEGIASLRITVREGLFAGGTFTTQGVARSLTQYDALTFYAKASVTSDFDVFGTGVDLSTNLYISERTAVRLTTEWRKVVIPIPNPARLTAERGFFHFAESPEPGGHTVWIDNVRFETLGTAIQNPRPAMNSETLGGFVGGTVEVRNTRTRFDVDGETVTMLHSPRFFDYVSSNTDVAVADAGGLVRTVGPGDAEITAFLGDVQVDGKVTVRISPVPTEPPPLPTLPASDVVSIFSGSYGTGIQVESFAARFGGSQAAVTDIQIAGNTVKGYTNLNFAAIPFVQNFDASGMTHIHMDVYSVGIPVFKIKLVDFDGDRLRSQYEITFAPSTVPQMRADEWVSLDIPLTAFTGLTSTGSLRQLLISGPGTPLTTVFVDNIYFHK